MGPHDAVLAPVRATGALARAAGDLHTLAERALRDPDPVDEARDASTGFPPSSTR